MRLAEHLRRRGDPRAAADALAPVVAARPWSIEPALSRAGACSSPRATPPARRRRSPPCRRSGRAARASRRSSPTCESSRGSVGARLRERALLLDGADLALPPRARARGRPRGARGRPRRTAARRSAPTRRRARAARHVGGDGARRRGDRAPSTAAPRPSGSTRCSRSSTSRAWRTLGEVTVPHGADVLLLRTVKPDGLARSRSARAPRRDRCRSLASEPGDYVEVEHLRAARGLAGSYVADPFYFQVAGAALRSSYVVSAPEGLGLGVDRTGAGAGGGARGQPGGGPQRAGTSSRRSCPSPARCRCRSTCCSCRWGGRGSRGDPARPRRRGAGRTRPTEELARARGGGPGRGGGGRRARRARARGVRRVAWTILGQASRRRGRERGALERPRQPARRPEGAALGAGPADAHRARAPVLCGRRRLPVPEHRRVHAPAAARGAAAEWFLLDPSLRLAPFGAIPSSVLDVDAMELPEPGDRARDGPHAGARARRRGARRLGADRAQARRRRRRGGDRPLLRRDGGGGEGRAREARRRGAAPDRGGDPVAHVRRLRRAGDDDRGRGRSRRAARDPLARDGAGPRPRGRRWRRRGRAVY